MLITRCSFPCIYFLCYFFLVSSFLRCSPPFSICAVLLLNFSAPIYPFISMLLLIKSLCATFLLYVSAISLLRSILVFILHFHASFDRICSISHVALVCHFSALCFGDISAPIYPRLHFYAKLINSAPFYFTFEYLCHSSVPCFSYIFLRCFCDVSCFGDISGPIYPHLHFYAFSEQFRSCFKILYMCHDLSSSPFLPYSCPCIF
jgi:hypothetical protein